MLDKIKFSFAIAEDQSGLFTKEHVRQEAELRKGIKAYEECKENARKLRCLFTSDEIARLDEETSGC